MAAIKGSSWPGAAKTADGTGCRVLWDSGRELYFGVLALTRTSGAAVKGAAREVPVILMTLFTVSLPHL